MRFVRLTSNYPMLVALSARGRGKVGRSDKLRGKAGRDGGRSPALNSPITIQFNFTFICVTYLLLNVVGQHPFSLTNSARLA